MLLTYCVVWIMVISRLEALPSGAPSCLASPSNGHNTEEQPFEDFAGNFYLEKSMESDGSIVLTIQSIIEGPLESVYVEDSFMGFLVKTYEYGHFVETEGVQVMECNDVRWKAVTHKDRRAKSNLKIVFYPQYRSFFGRGRQPIFYITLVKDFSTFWEDVEV